MSLLSVSLCYFLIVFIATDVVRAENSEFFIQKILLRFVSIPDCQYSGGTSRWNVQRGGHSQKSPALKAKFSYQP